MKTENNDVIKDCIKFITDFLVKNDFYFVSENTLVNEKCSVEILKKEDTEIDYYYKISFIDEYYEDVYTVSNNLNICWLIGFLTYNDLTEKNYKTL